MAVPPEVLDILLLALFNPATLVAGYWFGRNADQVQKIIVGAFAAGLAGTFFAWLVMRFGMTTGTPKPPLWSGCWRASRRCVSPP